LRAALGGISFALLVLVSTAALLGEPRQAENLAPTFVWVVFWLGLVPVVVLLGNVWPALNPWRAAADAAAWFWTRLGGSWKPPFAYPERLGCWPAAALLFLFTAFELAYSDPSNPRALALGIYLYSAIAWYGMLFFGREAWLANGEAFSVYFGLLSRLAPFAVGDGRVVLRPPVVGLARLDPRRGTLAFVAVMLGSVGFDGFSRTRGWQDFRFSLVTKTGSFELVGTLVNLAGLAASVALVALAYLAAVAAARAVAGAEGSLASAFVGSLVPIALVYAVAHYFSLLATQGQFAIPLASDPFGWGWDLFGTADYRPNLVPFSPNTIWYVQVAALLGGHVLALTLAHDRAVALFRSARRAARTQYAMLALMVLYTVGGLWLLSQG
jgi:hypothetical protein